jgi:O-acetylhomoserine/O-acetylserine sulfhydrylase-like pyridoxal-dependent enzyme
VFTVTLKQGEAAARAALGRLRLFSHLVNIGETRSLVSHPASTTHRTLRDDERAALGITPGTLRLSVGLEDVQDLIDDWNQALA